MKNLPTKPSPFKIEYWLKKGFSNDESIEKVRIHRLKCIRTLESFIYNHGEINGLLKFKEFCDKSKHTLESFMKKYGKEDGKLKWDAYLKTKDSNSEKWALKKSNGDVYKANEILKERKKNVIVTLDKLIIKYNDIELAKEKLKDINKRKDSSSLKYFIKKTNGDLKLATILYKERSLKKDCMSINFFLKKTNGDLKLAKDLQVSELNRRNISFCIASKESLVYFIPLYKYLRKNGFKRSDIFLGVNGSYEYKLHDVDKNITFSYDFTVPSLGLIIEYHGEKFHPNIKKYGVNKLRENRWGKHFRLDLDKSILKDKTKKELAITNNFEYIELWSSDSEEINKEKIIKFLKINKL